MVYHDSDMHSMSVDDALEVAKLYYDPTVLEMEEALTVLANEVRHLRAVLRIDKPSEEREE